MKKLEMKKIKLFFDDKKSQDKKWSCACEIADLFANDPYNYREYGMGRALLDADKIEVHVSVCEAFDIPEVLSLNVKFFQKGEKEPNTFLEALFNKGGKLLHVARPA